MTPLLIDHVAFALLAIVFPIWNYLWIRRRATLIGAGRSELRMGMYRRTIVEEWIMAIVLLAGWFALGRSAAALGLVPVGGVVPWIGYGLTALACAALVIQAWWLLRNPSSLASLRETLGDLRFLMPHTLKERRAFEAVSVTAGICEELIFRGYLIAYLMAVFSAPFWTAAVLSSFVFGFSHAYQGPAGIPKTAAAGGLFALLYGLTGSLWAPMVVHTVMDITSGRITHATTRLPAPERSAPDLAA